MCYNDCKQLFYSSRKGELPMKPEIYKFRSALGGFNRRDVTGYIEQAAREQQKQLEELAQRLARSEEENAALKAQLEGAQTQSGDLADQGSKMRASLEESTQSLTRLRGEMKTAQTQLAVAKKELAGLQQKVAELEPVARQYEALKDRVATVELDAHRKAQTTVDEAQAQAGALREETRRWVEELCGEYLALKDTLEGCVSQTEAAGRLFAEKEETCRALLRRAGAEQEAAEGAQ